MAARLTEKTGAHGSTPLTLDGQGWSMKDNLLWDKVLSLGLIREELYTNELRSYLPGCGGKPRPAFPSRIGRT